MQWIVLIDCGLIFAVLCNRVQTAAKKFIINVSSAIYDMLLREADKQIANITATTDTSNHDADSKSLISDEDDVYFRFGGGALASMLHRRYNDIRKCDDGKRDIISLEITVLHAINTKDKSSIPAHLKYRDRGYMYSPDVSFIPFIRAVDECINSLTTIMF